MKGILGRTESAIMSPYFNKKWALDYLLASEFLINWCMITFVLLGSRNSLRIKGKGEKSKRINETKSNSYWVSQKTEKLDRPSLSELYSLQ